jgi:PncC family amidohydrolase
MNEAAMSDAPTVAEIGPVDSPEKLVEIASRIQDACVAAGLTIALAESCTGGLIAHLITEIPGSSGYLRGGIVSYSDEAKIALLDVDEEVLRAHGAVSAQVARQMAVGVRARLAADLGVSVTGIAGPDGGSAAKPVGLTYVGVADGDGVEVRRHLWQGSRSDNKRASAGSALELLLDHVQAVAERRREQTPT